MSMRIWVRGATTVTCIAFAATAVLSPAQAAPPTTSLPGLSWGQLAVTPLSPDLPSLEEIEQAKKSEAATAAESTKIEAILTAANEQLQTSTVATLRANTNYTDALVVLDERRAEAKTTQAKAGVAAKEFKSAKSDLGQLASNLYKSGGLDLNLQSFLGSSDADDAIYQASTLMALTANRSHTFSTAEATSATSTALQAQATEAQKAADTAAKTADDSKIAAQAATTAQAAAVKVNQAQRDASLQKLATLHDSTVALEGARVDALAQKAQEAALAEQIKNSAKVAEPEVPSADTPTAPAESTPVTQAPATAAPVAPVAPVTPVTPEAPVAPVAPPVAPVAPPVAPVAPPVAPVAPPVAPVTPVVPETPSTPTQPAGSYIQVMVNFAMSQKGKPYAWGGNGPNSYDCSGLVQQAFAAAGISVPRTGTAQFWNAPTRVPLSQMRYGDLLVFDDDGTGNFGHVAIYIGNGQVVQALYYGYPLGVYSLSSMSTMSLYPYAARY